MLDHCTIPCPSDIFDARAFEHQAGGHLGLSTPDDNHVCKPCGDKEILFYTNLPLALSPFVPNFCGYIKDSSSLFTPSSSLCCSHCKTHPSSSSPPLPDSFASHALVLQQTPLRQHRDSPLMMKRLNKARNLIVLSNLAARFAHPNIMDMKLGTRQFGDDASEEKRAIHEERCRGSTSALWGVRLCGMKMYDEASNLYETVDKYAGREMSIDQLEDSIRIFLSDVEGKPREALCTKILKKINKLKKVIESLDGLRLFGSSLLIIHESASQMEQHNNMDAAVEVALVDFANASFDFDGRYSGPDEGCLLGISTLESFITNLISCSEN